MKAVNYEKDLGWLPMVVDMEKRRLAHKIWLAAETKDEAWQKIFAAFPEAQNAKSYFDNAPPRKYEIEDLPDYEEAVEFERHDPLYRARGGRGVCEENPIEHGVDFE